jgi:hypothetical protein
MQPTVVPRGGLVLDFCTVGREYQVGRALRVRQKATNYLYLPNNNRNIAYNVDGMLI